jgi:uncharacterized membrane protein YeaQ/YmgE (transglycosylase-associated protein family)
MKKIIVAVFVGSICMVIVDLVFARLTSSMLAIPVSVFVGACVAGWITEKHSWFFGLMVGLVNVLIALVLFQLLSPEEILHESGYSASDVLARPIIFSIIFGFIGGLTGGFLKNKLRPHQTKMADV